jgi:two-component system, NtrC family, nitrogen regulation sensor histidine kinase NtrY
LRNSAEAVESDVRPKVVAQASITASVTTLTLSDNGKGIPQDQIARVFIPFFTTKPQGTGLGLALVHRIITQHGGTITVSSNPVGTGFTITLPVPVSAGFAAKTAADPE